MCYRSKVYLYIYVLLSQICPQLGLCPTAEGSVALDATHVVNDKPTCPLCLLATQSIIEKLRNNKTEVSTYLKVKSSVFILSSGDIMLCNSLKSQPTFRRNELPPSLKSKSKPNKKPA